MKFFPLVWVYCTCAVIPSVGSLYGYRIDMTRPTTARLLAMEAYDVKPGQYGYLLTGQYLFIYLFI